jgi:hypothetical protein
MRRAGCVCILAIWAVLPAGPCLAQLGEHERLALTVAPYVDMQTLVIAHFDLAVIDAPRTVTMLARLMRLSEQEHARLQGEFAPLEVLHGALPEGGSADVFIVRRKSGAEWRPARRQSRKRPQSGWLAVFRGRVAGQKIASQPDRIGGSPRGCHRKQSRGHLGKNRQRRNRGESKHDRAAEESAAHRPC